MTMPTKTLSPIGAEVHTDIETLLGDAQAPEQILDLLEASGVVVFPELGLDDAQLVAFGRRLGELETRGPNAMGGAELPEIYRVSLDPTQNSAYTKGTFNWHIDGSTEEIPDKASLLVGRVVPDGEGDTQFASTYAAYDQLSDEEKQRFAGMKVVHSVEAALRRVDPDPEPELLKRIRSVPSRLQPLVWTHRSGRRSLVLGATASHIDGLPEDEGAELLADLLDRATTPDRVYSHRWHTGDLVIWDNRGVLHRAMPYPVESGRMMHRVTLVGDEPFE